MRGEGEKGKSERGRERKKKLGAAKHEVAYERQEETEERGNERWLWEREGGQAEGEKREGKR